MIKRLRQDERGVALVMALGLMVALGIAVTAVSGAIFRSPSSTPGSCQSPACQTSSTPRKWRPTTSSRASTL